MVGREDVLAVTGAGEGDRTLTGQKSHRILSPPTRTAKSSESLSHTTLPAGFSDTPICEELSLPDTSGGRKAGDDSPDPIGVCPLCREEIYIPFCEHNRLECPEVPRVHV